MLQFELMNSFKTRARKNPKTIVLPEGSEPRTLKAAAIINEEKLATVILVGQESGIRAAAAAEHANIRDIRIVDPDASELLPICPDLHELRSQGHEYGRGRQDDARSGLFCHDDGLCR